MTAMHSFAETGRPEIPAAESFAIREPLAARKMLGLADLPTVVALGPFDDLTQSENLAAAFTAVRRFCMAQLVLLGAHDRRTEAIRGGIGLGAEKRVHVVDATRGSRWSDLIVAADLVVVGPTSGETSLLDVLAAGRAVVAPADPVTVRLVVPSSAGLVYRPGDLAGMTAAMSRILTNASLRYGMATRAVEVARRHQRQQMTGSDHE